MEGAEMTSADRRTPRDAQCRRKDFEAKACVSAFVDRSLALITNNAARRSVQTSSADDMRLALERCLA
jgi:hypothetical protein